MPSWKYKVPQRPRDDSKRRRQSSFGGLRMIFPVDTVLERNAKRNYSGMTAPHFFCHPEASEGSGCCALPQGFLEDLTNTLVILQNIQSLQRQNSQILRRPQDDSKKGVLSSQSCSRWLSSWGLRRIWLFLYSPQSKKRKRYANKKPFHFGRVLK